MNICVIPARAGSKRIPRKNIKLFRGKPMISWSIEAAKAAGCFDRIIVSTDDDEIAEVSTSYGAEVPFVRPAYLADDFSSTVDVMQHAASWIQRHVAGCDVLCCLYATAPLLRVNDLLDGLRFLRSERLNYVYSVSRFEFPIQRALFLSEDGVFAVDPEGYEKRSQDLEVMWHDSGQFYWGTIDSFASAKPLVGPEVGVVKVPTENCQDIDDISDWRHAEIKAGLISGDSI